MSFRDWAVALAHSAGPARHDYIFILQKMYIHIYNLHLILKTYEHDVLLVRQLYLVSHTLLSSGHGFKPHLLVGVSRPGGPWADE
jgi:hypothetical protein